MLRTIPYQYLDAEKKTLVLQWRNDDRIRRYMKNTAVIPYSTHSEFIENLKVNNNKHYFLVLDDELCIGTINLNKIDRYTAEGGLLKNPDLKEPVGTKLISCLEREAVKHNYSAILLEVQKSNLKAQQLYEKAGYRKTDETETYNIYKKENLVHTIIIAELSANHNQSLELAKKSIEAAADAGADAVKIQTYTADTITIDCDNEYFRIDQGTLWDGRTLYDLYKEAYTPWEWHEELRDLAESLGMVFFSTPFDKTAVDFLEGKNVPWYKIASFEITDTPLIEYTASKGKPMIISTGIADAGDIQLAIDTCRKVGNNDITLLQCTSSYPAPAEDANLIMIPNLAETFGVKSGLSDHTLGSAVSIAAVALGATIVEKHFILDRNMGGPDAAFSIQPEEFKKMVDDIRTVEMALGKVDYTLSEKKKKSRKFSRSLFVVEDIPEGGIITESNVRSIRPGDGLHPRYLDYIYKRKVNKKIYLGDPFRLEMLNVEENKLGSMI